MVRYGIIGSGTMGREHIQNLRLIPEVKVVALAARTRPRSMRRQRS